MISVSCIIPAYNEEKRIENVLNVVIKHQLINEIIVIDDASTDNTKEVIKKYPSVNLLSHEKNQGKSKSVYDGIKSAKGDIIMLLDADLVGITEGNISALIEPVITNNVNTSISLRLNAPLLWKLLGIDYISGERVIPKKLILEQIENMSSLPGFGLEVFLNRVIIKNSLKIGVVNWNNVKSPYKYRKYGFLKGIKSDLLMMVDILRTVGIFGALYQIFSMIQLKK